MAIIYGTPRAPYFYHVEVRMAFQSTLSTLCLIFIARQHILTRDIDIASLSVCPSRPPVRPSHTGRPVLNTLTYCHNFFTTR